MSNDDKKLTDRIKSQEMINAIQSAGYRNGFLPEAMKKMAFIAVLNTSLSMVLIASLVAIYIFRPQPQAYGLSPSGRIVKMVPLNENIDSNSDLGQSTIANYVANAIVDGYSIDFLNWQKQLSALAPYFTPAGYNAFMVAIEPLKDRVVNDRFITSVSLASPPVIEKSAVVGGVMKYRIGLDIMVGMESQLKKVNPQMWHVEVIAERVPFSQNPVGVAISSAVATLADKS
jgi:intracellular multiplication protein IcmL